MAEVTPLSHLRAPLPGCVRTCLCIMLEPWGTLKQNQSAKHSHSMEMVVFMGWRVDRSWLRAALKDWLSLYLN